MDKADKIIEQIERETKNPYNHSFFIMQEGRTITSFVSSDKEASLLLLEAMNKNSRIMNVILNAAANYHAERDEIYMIKYIEGVGEIMKEYDRKPPWESSINRVEDRINDLAKRKAMDIIKNPGSN